MDIDKVKKEIDKILHTWGVRSIDPNSLRYDILKLIKKYNVDVSILNPTSDANRTRNRTQKGRSIQKTNRRTNI